MQGLGVWGCRVWGLGALGCDLEGCCMSWRPKSAIFRGICEGFLMILMISEGMCFRVWGGGVRETSDFGTPKNGLGLRLWALSFGV